MTNMDMQREIRLYLPAPTKLLTPAVVTFLVLMVIGLALITYAENFTLENLALSRVGIAQLKLWQPLTYPFVNGICTLIFNGLVILFFGSAIERQWGTLGIFLLALFVVVFCALLWLLVSLAFGRNFVGLGANCLAYGFVGAFGVLFRKQRFWVWLWTLEGQTIAWIMIAIGLIISIAWPLLLVWVSGALIAYLYVKGRWYWQENRSFSSAAEGQPGARPGGFVDLD